MEDDSKDRVGYFSHAIDKSKLKPGDHIYVYNSWLGYSHHGIYTGDNRVIHFAGGAEQGGWFSSGSSVAKSSAKIQACTLDEFLNGNQLRLVAYDADSLARRIKRSGCCHIKASRNVEEVLKEAEYYLQNPAKWGRYNLITNNCEHFAYYCKTGIKMSAQAAEFVSPSTMT